MSKKLVVVDLSHHNPEPDWDKLKAGGTLGVILKATEGRTFIDKTFAARRESARAAGLAVCSYHFLRHGHPEAQMLHYLDVVAPQRGERVVIDYEDPRCTLDDLCAAVEALARQPLNLQITIYSGHLIKEQLGDDREQLLADFTSLWVAQYTNAAKPSWPTYTWPMWSLWQFTDKARVPGIDKPVDGNRFNGSAEACLRFLCPAPDPEPARPVVGVSLTVPQGVQLEITVNGEKIAA